MAPGAPVPQSNSFAVLKQFVRKPSLVERCEMCSAELAPEHDHLVEPANRRLICACTACALLFDAEEAKRYKRVPRTVKFLRDFQLTDSQWAGLMVPIDMAFFYRSTPHGKMIALYPSPAGPTESLLTLDTWNEIVESNPVLQNMPADVVALLVNRVGCASGSRPAEYFLVPIDECYKLVGLIRTHWRGLSGGTEVWREIGAFFNALKKRAGFVPEATHA